MLNESEVSDLELSIRETLPSKKYFLISALRNEGTLSSLDSFLRSSFSEKDESQNLNLQNNEEKKTFFYPVHQVYDFVKNSLDMEVRKVRKSL